jgi:hypothetical protein
MMMRHVLGRWCVGLAAMALVGPLLFLACQDEETAGPEPTGTGLRIVTSTPIPTAAPTLPPQLTATTGTPMPTPVPNVCPENPNPAQPNIMVVEEPKPSDHLTSPTHVRGWGVGIGFESQGVHVAIYDSTGEPLKEMMGPPLPKEGRTPPPGMEMSEFTAPFAVDIAFSTSVSQPGCVSVFGISSADGRPVNVVQVPVLLQP